jgi:hypothetical protein
MNTFQVSSEKTTQHNTYGGRRYICVFLSLPTVCSAVEDKQTWSSKNTEQKIVARKKEEAAAATTVQAPQQQQQQQQADEAQEEEEASRPWQLCNTKWRGQTRSLRSGAALAGRRRRRVTTTKQDKRAKTKQKKKKTGKKTEKQKAKQNKGVGQVGAQGSAPKNVYWLGPPTFCDAQRWGQNYRPKFGIPTF